MEMHMEWRAVWLRPILRVIRLRRIDKNAAGAAAEIRHVRRPPSLTVISWQLFVAITASAAMFDHVTKQHFDLVSIRSGPIAINQLACAMGAAPLIPVTRPLIAAAGCSNERRRTTTSSGAIYINRPRAWTGVTRPPGRV